MPARAWQRHSFVNDHPLVLWCVHHFWCGQFMTQKWTCVFPVCGTYPYPLVVIWLWKIGEHLIFIDIYRLFIDDKNHDIKNHHVPILQTVQSPEGCFSAIHRSPPAELSTNWSLCKRRPAPRPVEIFGTGLVMDSQYWKIACFNCGCITEKKIII